MTSASRSARTERLFPLQPHFGVNRVAYWAPSSGTTINAIGMPRTGVGTASTPGLATTNLSTSMRRWRMTSAATVDASAEERSAGWVCWRGNAEGLGGFTYVNRLSLTTLQPTGMEFFGLMGSTAALATTLLLSAVVIRSYLALFTLIVDALRDCRCGDGRADHFQWAHLWLEGGKRSRLYVRSGKKASRPIRYCCLIFVL